MFLTVNAFGAFHKIKKRIFSTNIRIGGSRECRFVIHQSTCNYYHHNYFITKIFLFIHLTNVRNQMYNKLH